MTVLQASNMHRQLAARLPGMDIPQEALLEPIGIETQQVLVRNKSKILNMIAEDSQEFRGQAQAPLIDVYAKPDLQKYEQQTKNKGKQEPEVRAIPAGSGSAYDAYSAPQVHQLALGQALQLPESGSGKGRGSPGQNEYMQKGARKGAGKNNKNAKGGKSNKGNGKGDGGKGQQQYQQQNPTSQASGPYPSQSPPGVGPGVGPGMQPGGGPGVHPSAIMPWLQTLAANMQAQQKQQQQQQQHMMKSWA